jgi:hypothetical protein
MARKQLPAPGKKTAEAAPASPPADWGPPLVVGFLWLACLVRALFFVGEYGRNLPYKDDWAYTDVLSGATPLSPSWLWALHNEHRIPIPKAIYVALFRLSGNDFRAAMFFNVAVLAGLALAAAFVVKHLRGAWSYTDAVFPVALLSLGHFSNILWAFQVQFVSSTLLAGVLLLLISSSPGGLTPRQARAAGLALVGLLGCGANGLALVPALALWAAWQGAARLSSSAPDDVRAARWLLASAGAAVLLGGLYFLHYHPDNSMFEFQREEAPRAQHDLTTVLPVAWQFLAMAFGPAMRPHWEWVAAGLGVLLLATAGVLVRVWRREAKERFRAAGLLAYLAAFACLALGVGWGREEYGSKIGLTARYITLAAPVLCCAYISWELYGFARVRRLVQTTLLLAGMYWLWQNDNLGVEYAKAFSQHMDAFTARLAEGVPSFVLSNEFVPFLYHTESGLQTKMQQLQQAGIGPFSQLRPETPVREVPLPVVPSAVTGMEWDTARQAGSGPGVNSMMSFRLSSPRFVYAVRLRLTLTHQSRESALLALRWSSGNRPSTPDEKAVRRFPPKDEEQTLVLWVNGLVDRFELHPDFYPYRLKLHEITVLERP